MITRFLLLRFPDGQAIVEKFSGRTFDEAQRKAVDTLAKEYQPGVWFEIVSSQLVAQDFIRENTR